VPAALPQHIAEEFYRVRVEIHRGALLKEKDTVPIKVLQQLWAYLHTREANVHGEPDRDLINNVNWVDPKFPGATKLEFYLPRHSKGSATLHALLEGNKTKVITFKHLPPLQLTDQSWVQHELEARQGQAEKALTKLAEMEAWRRANLWSIAVKPDHRGRATTLNVAQRMLEHAFLGVTGVRWDVWKVGNTTVADLSSHMILAYVRDRRAASWPTLLQDPENPSHKAEYSLDKRYTIPAKHCPRCHPHRCRGRPGGPLRGWQQCPVYNWAKQDPQEKQQSNKRVITRTDMMQGNSRARQALADAQARPWSGNT
jgi:hypothetical protein